VFNATTLFDRDIPWSKKVSSLPKKRKKRK